MGKRFTFTAQEQTLIGACIELAQKAGKAAQSACMLAYLTQGEHEAQLLVGYADEAEQVMKKPNDDGTFELSRGAVEAIRVGVNVYGEKLAKAEKTDTALLLGTEDHQSRRDEAQRLAIKLSDDLFTQREPVREGAGKPPKQENPKRSKEVAVVIASDPGAGDDTTVASHIPIEPVVQRALPATTERDDDAAESSPYDDEPARDVNEPQVDDLAAKRARDAKRKRDARAAKKNGNK